MPSPFPGMDPWLENPQSWRGTHTLLIAEASKQLNQKLGKRYVSRIEERVYLTEEDDAGGDYIIPDIFVTRRKPAGEPRRSNGSTATAERKSAQPVRFVLNRENKERYLSIVEVSPRRVITTIEMLSPTSKQPGSEGYNVYHRKRREVLNSATNLVEVDLLRKGRPRLAPGVYPACDYRVIAVRSSGRDSGIVWPILMEQVLPVVQIPLKEAEESVALDLQSVLDTVYDEHAFAKFIDYDADPVPPLSPAQLKWAKKLLKAKRQR